MTDRPIIFSAPMVRALLDGRKTQTRRILKLPKWASTDPSHIEFGSSGEPEVICRDTGCLVALPLPYAAGDRLWVRENCQAHEQASGEDGVHFPADEAWEPIQAGSRQAADDWVTLNHYGRRRGAVVPSIHMPRWASRLTLVVTEVRVQRLNDLSRMDAMAEGIAPIGFRAGFEAPGQEGGTRYDTAIEAFAALWNGIHGAEAWAADPWVAAISFSVHRGNIDALGIGEAA